MRNEQHFFEWFEANNPRIPEGTQMILQYDAKSDQWTVTYEIGGDEYIRHFNADVANGGIVYTEVGK